MKLKQVESVIFAENFETLKDWYIQTLGFKIDSIFQDDYHYCALSHPGGAKLGIADAKEMNITLGTRTQNSVVLQFQVPDVAAFFKVLTANAGSITFGPSFDNANQFWFGGFQDIEGNPFWVVDDNCP